jgi:thiamine biosynthesis protein ThiI
MVLLVRYGEIHLKGLNRPHFEMLQRKALQRALKGFPAAKVVKGQGRFYIEGLEETEVYRAIPVVTKVFGLHSVSPALEVEKDIGKIEEAFAELARSYMGKKGMDKATFKVEASRADKRFPLGSMQLAARAGGYILDKIHRSAWMCTTRYTRIC